MKKPRMNAPTPGPGRGHFSLKGESRAEREKRHAEEARELYYRVMQNDEEATPNRLTAATKLLDRIEGLPVQKLVTEQSDDVSRMTPEEKRAELDRVQALQRAKGQGNAAAR